MAFTYFATACTLNKQHLQQCRFLHLKLLYCDDSLCDDFFSKLLQDAFLLLDLLVHQRLSEHGLIHLIMAVTSVTHLKVKRQEFRHYTFILTQSSDQSAC